MINWNRCSRSAEFSVHDPPEHETSSHATIDVPARLNVCHITILGQASRRTSTSCGFHATGRRAFLPSYLSNMAFGVPRYRARFLASCPGASRRTFGGPSDHSGRRLLHDLCAIRTRAVGRRCLPPPVICKLGARRSPSRRTGTVCERLKPARGPRSQCMVGGITSHEQD